MYCLGMALAVALTVSPLVAQWQSIRLRSGPEPPTPSVAGEYQIWVDTTGKLRAKDSAGTLSQIVSSDGSVGSSSTIPAGSILLVISGTCPAGFTEVAALNGKMLVGTLAANGDIGTTGGSDTATPTFSGQAATLSHFGTAVSAHTGTAVANHSFTQPTVAWPVGVPTNSGGAVNAHSGTAVADHASHTHTYTDVPNHVHVENINTATTGGLTGFPALADTSTSGSTATGVSTANNTGGVATGTTAGPNVTLTHSVTQPATHVFTQPTIAWPAGVPTNSGGAVDAHSVTQPSNHTVTQPSDHSYTPAGTISAINTRPAFVKVIFCSKN